MPWHELQINVTPNELTRIEAFLRLTGAEAISLAGNDGHEIIEPAPGETVVWHSIRLTALFPPSTSINLIKDYLCTAAKIEGLITEHEVQEKDWLDGLKRRPSIQYIGKQLLLAPADSKLEYKNRTCVKLNLGLAFGTGEHPTTSLCLEWIDANLKPGSQVLDYGCGSGILAISTLRLKASQAWAVDIEPQALLATKDNAELNGVEDRLWIGVPENLPNLQVDLIVSNIIAGTLENLTEVFKQCLRPGGHLILSGILESQVTKITRCYAKEFKAFTKQQKEGWVLLCAQRRKNLP